MGLNEAAKAYGVPKATLSRHEKNKISMQTKMLNFMVEFLVSAKI